MNKPEHLPVHSSSKDQEAVEISAQYFFELSKLNFEHKQIFSQKNSQVSAPVWRLFEKINPYILSKTADKKSSSTVNLGKTVGSVYIHDKNIFIDEGTVIEHGAMIKGPCIIGKNCEIRKGSLIRQNVIIGDNCLIGNSCELICCILMDRSEVGHFNYIGESLLGEASHLASGAVTSNMKLDSSNIIAQTSKKKYYDTGLMRFGAILGNRAQIGCNVVLNPGSLIGKDCVILPNISFRGFLPNRRMLKLTQQTEKVIKKGPSNCGNL